MTNRATFPLPKPFTLWIIWAALFVSIAIHGAIGLLIGQTTAGTGNGEPGSSLLPVFAALAAVLLAASLALRFLFLSVPLPDPHLDPGHPARLQRHFALQIVSFALCEAAALLGLVLRLSEGIEPRVFVSFLVAGLLGLLVQAPLHVPLQDRP